MRGIPEERADLEVASKAEGVEGIEATGVEEEAALEELLLIVG